MRRAGLIAIAVAACSAPAPLPSLHRAEALERAGQADQALAAYQQAQVDCQTVQPLRRRQELCAQALVAEAALLEDQHRTDEAIAAWEAIPARAANDPEPSARALYRAGAMHLERGDTTAAWTALWKVVTDFPDEAFAADALQLLLRDGRGRDARALFGELAKIVGGLPESRVADNALWSMADLAEHELHDPVAARDLYDRIPEDYPGSGLRDDARWRAAALTRQQGDAQGAVTRLRALLATREVALGAGSYFSIWLDDAQLELGRVLRDDLGDTAGAIAAFRQLGKDYPASILRDDASFELAATLAKAGDRAGACAELTSLLRQWPDSKYLLERGPALGQELGCPLATTPAATAGSAMVRP